MSERKIPWVPLVFFGIIWFGFAGAIFNGALYSNTLILDRFSTGTTPPPLTSDTAEKWRVLTYSYIQGADIDVDSAYILVNGKEIGAPSKETGYIESNHPVRQGDRIEVQVEESGYYTTVHSFTVPHLDPLEGGATYYVLDEIEIQKNAHADATISATYAGTDIDASNWDISANTEYAGVEVTLDVEKTNFAYCSMGPSKFTELVGDKDTMSKFIKFDANDSDIILKDVKLEGVPLKLVWTTFADGSDYQAIYEFDQILVNDGRVSNDGFYDLTFTVEFGDADNTLAVSYHVGRADSTSGVDVESAAVGSVGTADETVTITTE